MSVFTIISDIHGDPFFLNQALKIAEKEKTDFYILLGDLLNHGPRNGISDNYNPMEVPNILNGIRSKITAVRGNCDSEVDQKLCLFPLSKPAATIFINKHRAILTHGHILTENDCENLALGKDDFFMSGHTHKAILKRNKNGTIIFNPGSITFPKSEERSIGVINEEEGYIKLLSLNNECLAELALNS